MRETLFLVIFFISCVILSPGLLFAQSSDEAPAEVSQPDLQGFEEQVASDEAADETDDLSDYYEPEGFEDDYNSDESRPIILDPLEPVNRVFFLFNDRLYFWFLKPVARGYSAVAPAPVRKGIKNFFSNLGFPIRFINCLLQAKFAGAGYEFERFFVNSTMGLAGFIDMADREFGVKAFDEDFGQTLGFYGLGHGFYINWPVFGPSSALETVGMAGDYFLEPTYHMDMEFREKAGLKVFKTINSTSLTLGDYETLKNSALDPYVAFRDAYVQYRQSKIKE
jgi:phospholipid-binding lipoprotein MlaA